MMGEGSIGAVVPSVKSEPRATSITEQPIAAAAATSTGNGGGIVEIDKDLLCPISIEEDICLSNSKICIPNGASSSGIATGIHDVILVVKYCPSVPNTGIWTKISFDLCHVVEIKGYEVSVKELDSLLSLLAEKKKKKEQEEAESNMLILLDFLHCLRKQKVEELNEVDIVTLELTVTCKTILSSSLLTKLNL
ncbi:hypothetical protein IFM89_024754 [Coptis chinensis]|uniref:Uncharacterized protein n=1 Tax=Coptis chinensis TaxID=261450 RepID=A0A835H2F1_9MAGN|nr:hypothetical protein IFM89_024754 [Coptis chinensis]